MNLPFLGFDSGFTTDGLLMLAASGGGAGVEHTIINNPATFTTDLAKPLRKLLIPFTPVQAGTGDPSPDNVRPISGFTGVNISRTGNNVCGCEWEDGTVNGSTGEDYDDGTQKYRTKGYFAIKGGSLYYVVDGSQYKRVYWYDSGKAFISSNTTSQNVKTAPAKACYARAVVEASKTPNPAATYAFNFPSTDTDYHAYSGETIPVSWQTEAGEVYGGELDALTGVLTVTHEKLTFDGSDLWSFAAGEETNRLLKSISAYVEKKEAYPPFNYMKSATSGAWTGYVSSAGNVVCRVPTTITSREAWSAYLAENPLEVVVELATPYTVQLDPVTLSTLIGENVVWTDTNGDNTITYLKKT